MTRRRRSHVIDLRTASEERLTEAKEKTWLGEVSALEEGLRHLRVRRDEAQRRQPDGPLLASSGPTDGTLSR